MSSSSQFKRVNGHNGKSESICMRCLLAVGISFSDEELAVKERQHKCKSEDGLVMELNKEDVAQSIKEKQKWDLRKPF